MNVKSMIPAPGAVVREAAVTIGGAVLAAVFLTYVAPGLKAWIAERLPWARKD